jgi:hypothetical protein
MHHWSAGYFGSSVTSTVWPFLATRNCLGLSAVESFGVDEQTEKTIAPVKQRVVLDRERFVSAQGHFKWIGRE